MSAEEMPTPSPVNANAVPDLSALDSALREVIAAAQIERSPAAAPIDVLEDDTGEMSATLDVVARAASTVDQLVERHRSLTDAAVRSVDYFRTEAEQARAETEQLRAEMNVLREENEALKVAALAYADELEAELAARTHELDVARSWIADIRGHVETLLGNVETRLSETKAQGLFEER